MPENTTTSHPLIQYRGFFRGPKDTGGMTALYPTHSEALLAAWRCCMPDQGETAWVNPEYVGPLEAALEAVETLEYIDWRGMPQRKAIRPGERFRPGDIMIADHQVTRQTVGRWLTTGSARGFDVAPLQRYTSTRTEPKEGSMKLLD